MVGELVRISANKSFGGMHERYEHQSAATGTKMIVGVYRPPQALEGKSVPFVTWLSGLTCTDQNFMEKAGSNRPFSIVATIREAVEKLQHPYH